MHTVLEGNFSNYMSVIAQCSILNIYIYIPSSKSFIVERDRGNKNPAKKGRQELYRK